MKRMLRAYIAGPFSADTGWQVECNVRTAELVALEAWRAGFAAFCPHTNTRFFEGAEPYGLWLAGDIAWLEVSDLVITAGDWTKSKGAKKEVALAAAWKKPVFHTVEAAALWAGGEKPAPEPTKADWKEQE